MSYLYYNVFLYGVRSYHIVLRSCKAVTRSNPPVQPQTLESTISASCGHPLPASSLLRSSFAWGVRRLVLEGGKDLREDGSEGSEGGRRAQEAGAASSTRRRQLMVQVLWMETGHHLFAHRPSPWSKMAQGGRPGRFVDGEGDVSCCDDIHSIGFFFPQVHNAAMELSIVWKPEW